MAQDGTPSLQATTSPANLPGSVGCIPDQLTFTVPQPGDEVSGKIVLRGTINLSDLGFYKYEYAAQGNDEWIAIAAGNEIKTDSELSPWDVTNLIPGDYQLRLVATNNLGEPLPPCIIPVRVRASP